ncbi:probable serine/threonine-protein kinase DDB_G0286841 [Hylaeus volcanicus]|uniref:probable serine/threonine-protein kinase DDB_G0286841 n=1 Tax=Hylaeus volcanicus TaxID=313075 RepID=UPI0023B80CC3|nr:probable serine/threonine-protein kinase DDB_G0286841 [Hylaeus volcanicus]
MMESLEHVQPINDKKTPHEGKSRGCKRSDFQLKSLLGEGSIGRVYLCSNIFTQNQVALKIISKKKVMIKNLLKNVLLEKNILLCLNPHPNFVYLLSCFQDDAYLYFQLELVMGGSLSDVLFHYRMDIPELLMFYWVCDVVNILSHLRLNHVAHRDIKPDNLLIDQYGRLKLIDFNNAIFVHDQDDFKDLIDEKLDIQDALKQDSANVIYQSTWDTSSNKHEQFFGALHYLPPEAIIHIAPEIFSSNDFFQKKFLQWKQNNIEKIVKVDRPYSPYAIDVWNFGCVLFELFYGFHPFRGSTDIDTVFNILNYNMVSSTFSTRMNTKSSLKSQLLFDVIMGMLKKNPLQRLGAYDLLELKEHAFFVGIDLNVIPYYTLRPTIPSLTTFVNRIGDIPKETQINDSHTPSSISNLLHDKIC